MSLLDRVLNGLLFTAWDVLPLVIIVFAFQLLVVRRRIPGLKRVLVGFFYVLLGLTLFIEGLEVALFPLGRLMAQQLTEPAFIFGGLADWGGEIDWSDYYWVYIFGAAIGFSTAIAEPALIAVAIKAQAVSGGTIGMWGLRIAVATGAAIGVSLGTIRIVTGTPLHYYIIAGYVLVIVQTMFAPRGIIALAYDSGGVTTSTVTVPLVAALGLGLASTVPGRSPVLDGFGVIALAALCPIVSVLGYAQLTRCCRRKAKGSQTTQRSE